MAACRLRQADYGKAGHLTRGLGATQADARENSLLRCGDGAQRNSIFSNKIK